MTERIVNTDRPANPDTAKNNATDAASEVAHEAAPVDPAQLRRRIVADRLALAETVGELAERLDVRKHAAARASAATERARELAPMLGAAAGISVAAVAVLIISRIVRRRR